MLAPETIAPVASQRAFASFKCNRWPFTPGGRIANSVRIAIVGDSMVYGQGVPYLQTLGPRLAKHLNIARPGLWFDCQTFGVPGACAFHALARAESQAAAIDPDIVLIGLSQNDALMLRPQPPSAIATGQSWLDFAPILREALHGFVDRWRAAGHRAPIAVVYFDWCTDLAGVKPVDVLKPICEYADVTFVDGSEPLAGTASGEWWVSPIDAHVNAAGHDRVARHVARAILAQPWLPASADYDDPSWIDAMASAADSLVNGDTPRAIAASEALNTVRTKWLDRRNRSRAAHESSFLAIESRLRQQIRHSWPAAILQSYQCELGTVSSIPTQIRNTEELIYRANTLTYALRHAAKTGELGQPLDGLLSKWAEETPPSIGDLEPARQRAQMRASRAEALIAAVGRYAAGQAEFRGLISLASQARSANRATAWGLAELQQQLSGSLPRAFEVQRLLREGLAMWRAIDAALAEADARMAWPAIQPLLESFAPERAGMTLAINITAAAGTDQWVYRVGLDSPAQHVHEPYVACGWINRDGRVNSYAVDLPVLVSSTVTVHVEGQGLGAAADTGILKVAPASLEAPGVSPASFRLSRASRVSDTELTFEFKPTLFGRAE